VAEAPEPSKETARDVQSLLTVALGLAALVPTVSLLYLVLPWVLPSGVTGVIAQAGARVLVGANILLGVLLVAALYRSRRGVEAAANRPVVVPEPAVRPEESEPGQGLQALLASDRTDEIGALMREFTRILEVLQVQASQVQDYAGRFEAINEELRNANLRLRELSLTDELTEVGNRRNFDVRIREEINRSTRFGHSFSLLLLDLDYFKKFNDEFGHPQGDAVLRGLGALMRSMCREGDVPCRVGGEEFAFILPETAKADGLAFGERMRRGVETTIKCPDDSRPITISIGLAAFPEDGKSPEDVFRASDEALYESKNAGRNRVTAYTRK
jgi:diguanylate cyclase (GGDEF)-like protein